MQALEGHVSDEAKARSAGNEWIEGNMKGIGDRLKNLR